jgi:hypothetical protein
MFKWLHHLFNPHCDLCDARPKCESCEVLREQLALANAEKDKLLRYVLEPEPSLTTPKQGQQDEEEDGPILPKFVPWHVRRQMLESEDRKQAQLLAESKKDQDQAIKQLEKNLGIVQNTVLNLGDEDVQSESISERSKHDHKENEGKKEVTLRSEEGISLKA